MPRARWVLSWHTPLFEASTSVAVVLTEVLPLSYSIFSFTHLMTPRTASRRVASLPSIALASSPTAPGSTSGVGVRNSSASKPYPAEDRGTSVTWGRAAPRHACPIAAMTSSRCGDVTRTRWTTFPNRSVNSMAPPGGLVSTLQLLPVWYRSVYGATIRKLSFRTTTSEYRYRAT